jgi:competence protein ComEC
MRWLAAHTWLLALIPLIAGILLCYYIKFPCDLFADTTVDYIGCDTVLCLHVVDEGQERSRSIRYIVRAEDGSRFLLYLQKDSLSFPRMGDILLVQTKVKRGEVLGDFDYGRYLQMQGLVGSAWANRQNWLVVDHRPINGLRAKAMHCQRWLHQRYKDMGIDKAELGILSALTLGYRDELDKDVQEYFSRAGAMHILAVSGLHTGIVWGMLLWLLTLGGLLKPLYEQRFWRIVLGSIALTALWVYAFVTGLSPSVMRSALMLTMVEVGWLLGRNVSNINSIAAAAVIILLINPLALWNVGFQLSFAAMIGIILVANRMQQHIVVRGKVWQYISGLIVMSIAAQVATLPLSLHYFGQTSNYFVLTNLVVIPTAFVLLLLGMGALAFSWCWVGDVIARVAESSTYGLRRFVEWIEGLPYASTHIELSALSVACCYGAVVCALMMMRGERVKWWWLLGVMLCGGGVVWGSVV